MYHQYNMYPVPCLPCLSICYLSIYLVIPILLSNVCNEEVLSVISLSSLVSPFPTLFCGISYIIIFLFIPLSSSFGFLILPCLPFFLLCLLSFYPLFSFLYFILSSSFFPLLRFLPSVIFPSRLFCHRLTLE
jgi:hypothetical protein